MVKRRLLLLLLLVMRGERLRMRRLMLTVSLVLLLFLLEKMIEVVMRLLPISFTHRCPQSRLHALSERFIGRVASFILLIALFYFLLRLCVHF